MRRIKEREREREREKEEMVEGDCEQRQCKIYDISASRNPFSLNLRPAFKFITSTTISDHVTLYARRERNMTQRIKEIDR